MPDRTLIVGVDSGRDDRTAVAIMERMRHGLHVHDVFFMKARRVGLTSLYRLCMKAIEKGDVMRCGRKSQRSTLRRLRFERNKARRLRQAKLKRKPPASLSARLFGEAMAAGYFARAFRR